MTLEIDPKPYQKSASKMLDILLLNKDLKKNELVQRLSISLGMPLILAHYFVSKRLGVKFPCEKAKSLMSFYNNTIKE